MIQLFNWWYGQLCLKSDFKNYDHAPPTHMCKGSDMTSHLYIFRLLGNYYYVSKKEKLFIKEFKLHQLSLLFGRYMHIIKLSIATTLCIYIYIYIYIYIANCFVIVLRGIHFEVARKDLEYEIIIGQRCSFVIDELFL